MPYPRYSDSAASGGGSYGGDGYGRRDAYGGQGGQPSPWQTAGASGLLPTPGPNQPRGADFMQAGNLLGSILGGNAGHQGAFASLAGQLAVAQAAIQAPPAPRFNDMPRMRPASPPRRRSRSPPRRRRSRSRSRDRSRSSRSSRKRGRSKSPPKDRAEYEIYIGNYPVRFKEEDLRELFKEHNIEVGVIRLKHDGQKVFGFAETIGKEEIEKAVKALDSKEINGRRLRVRAAGDKEKKPGDPGYKDKEKSRERSRSRDRGSSSSRRRNREVRVSDVKGHLTYAYIGFLEREMSEPGLNEEKKEKMARAIQVLKEAFDIPNDESLKVPRHLEIMFMQNNRREIKLPDIEPEKSDEKDRKEKPKEKEETKKGEENNKEEKGDDDGNWKRRKTENDEDEDEAADAAVAAKEDQDDHVDAVDEEKEAEIWKEADAPMLAEEAAPEEQEEEETEPSSVVDQEALEALAGVAEIAEGGEAAEESQEADAVAEVPVEEEAEPENEADDAPVELEEEAVPVAKSSPGRGRGRGRRARGRKS